MLKVFLLVWTVVVAEAGNCAHPFVPGVPREGVEHVNGFHVEDDEIPSSFDGRQTFSQCSLFYNNIGRSSFACGECWAQATVSYVGVFLCIRNKTVPEFPLGVRYSLGCIRHLKNSCLGGDYQHIHAAMYLGFTTGTNSPHAVPEGCIAYEMHLCRFPNVDSNCPNHSIFKHRRYNISLANKKCPKTCNDGTIIPKYGEHLSAQQWIPPISVQSMKKAIYKHGSIISAYFVGEKMRALGRKKAKIGSILSKFEHDYVGSANHYLTIVGWGNETVAGEVVKYWIVKQAYGNDFGEGGFVKVKMGINLNAIESEIFINYQEPDICREKLGLTIGKNFLVNGVQMKCFSEEGQQCPHGCKRDQFLLKNLKFTCKSPIGEDVIITKEVKVTTKCALD